MAKNLPKSKLKCFLVGMRSSGSKPLVDNDKGKGEQPVVSTVMEKKQHNERTLSRRKPKGEPNGWKNKNLCSPRDTPPSSTYQD